MISTKCANLIQAINIIALFSGFITTMVGVSLIPQNINNGSIYVGTAEEYHADLQKAQYSSYGFKVALAGTIIFGYGILGLICICIYNSVDSSRNTVVPIEAAYIQPPAVSSLDGIKPIKSILKPTPVYEIRENTRKWIGTVDSDIV
jgi:hypothetical protein